MAVHVYMSVGKNNGKGALVDPTTGEVTNVMRHRGEISVGDDPKSFKEKMEAAGHIVEFHNEKVGEEVERDYGNSTQSAFEYNLGEV